MGRLSKAVLLALLLIFAGVPDIAPHLCAQPMASHAHSCCAPQQASATDCVKAATLSATPSCCKVVPIESVPIQPIGLPGAWQQGALGLCTTSAIFQLISPAMVFSGRGSPQSAKLLHPPVHALLCTFLV
jgi:hypothetical protein